MSSVRDTLDLVLTPATVLAAYPRRSDPDRPLSPYLIERLPQPVRDLVKERLTPSTEAYLVANTGTLLAVEVRNKRA
ncbi:MAG: hypothetical protein ACOYY2_03905 [Actinomycetota bacterium]